MEGRMRLARGEGFLEIENREKGETGYRVLLLGPQRSNSSSHLSREFSSKPLGLDERLPPPHAMPAANFTPLPLSTHEQSPFPAHPAPAGYVKFGYISFVLTSSISKNT
jgi:hypothetical protein